MHQRRGKQQERTIADNHSSCIKHVLIPLFGFKGYHQTVSEEEGDEDFIGRKAIIGKLKSWLSDWGSTTGAYMITGFRGMGKSSFVGKTLNELLRGGKHRKIAQRVRCLHWGIILAITFLSAYSCFNPLYILCWLAALALLSLMAEGIEALVFIRKKHATDHRHFLIIKINIGNEILGNQEIFHLITKSVYDRFKEYLHRYQGHYYLSFFPLCVKLALTVFLFHTLECPFPPLESKYGLWVYFHLRALYAKYIWLTAPLFFLLIYRLLSAIGHRLLFWGDCLEALPFQTGYGLLRRLHRLHERSIAKVSEDPGVAGQYMVVSLFRRKEYRAPSVHETEQELISIFSDMNKLLLGSPRPVIVLDELDKVSPMDEKTEPEDVPEFNPSVDGLNGKNGPRGRLRELLRMLGHMKYFMSTARAKFIFIAGRDLYDAYLKDVSDREFSVSSIFNGVINVQSFLKPASNKKGDITSMTEAFVCMRLMNTPETEKTLLSYYREEEKRIRQMEGDNNVRMKRLARNVGLIHQFILYLVHVSNGSPKKIAIHFERYIRTRDYLKQEKDMWLEESRECGYYLSFGFKEMQKIGFVYYMVYPVTQAMINRSKVYEDRLLVSISFMINHIYKFHNTGFSWRNLEHIPELLEINKTPELRDFIGTIISFLRKTHLTRILSGLYLFKFPMKISEEISFMSKRSEDLSALFNFSQDESLSIRRHYIHLLEYYARNINRIEGKELHAMASIHHILGDLYQVDEDYSQAIFEYQTGLQLLSRQLQGNNYDDNPHWVSYMLFLVRNMLKLGVTYEKRKTLDSAYLAYSELVQHLVDYRYFNEKDFGLHYQIESKNGKLDKDALLFFQAWAGTKEAQMLFPAYQEAQQKQGFAFQCDHLKTEFARLLTPLKNSVITRMAFFDDVRMAYLPILAKLSVLEKMNMEGITQHNLDVAEAEFFFLHLATDDSEKKMAAADFYNRFGDILYYKNGLMNNRTGNLFLALYFWGYDLGNLKDAICAPFLKSDTNMEQSQEYHNCRKKVECWFDEPADMIQMKIKNREGLKAYLKKYLMKNISFDSLQRDTTSNFDWLNDIFNDDFDKMVALEKVSRCVQHMSKFSQKGKRAPCYACKYYNQAMNVELERMMGWKWNPSMRKLSKAEIVAKLLLEYDEKVKGMREIQYSVIGDTLKGLGCTFMSCADETERIQASFLESYFLMLDFYYEKRPLLLPSMTPKKLEKVMLLYWEASVFYGMTDDNRSAYELNKRLMELLDAYLKIHPEDAEMIRTFLPKIKTLIADRAVMNWHAHYGHVHLTESRRMDAVFGRELYEHGRSGFVSPDVEEVMYGYFQLEMRCVPHTKWLGRLYESGLLGPYKQVSTLTQDILNLKVKALMNEQVFIKLFPRQREVFAICSYPDASCFYIDWVEFMQKDAVRIEGLYEAEDAGRNRVMLLEFLITDTLFCLAKIISLITPLNDTTLYTCSFVGEIYEHLWKWTRYYELVFLCYSAANWDVVEDSPAWEYVRSTEKLTYFFRKAVDGIRTSMCGRTENMAKMLKEEVIARIGIDTFYHLTRTEQIENVIHYYERAVEMHSEGKAYKEMIRTLFFLDDDLNNDTCQLAFGIERFLINTGWIQERLAYLKRLSVSAEAYNSEIF